MDFSPWRRLQGVLEYACRIARLRELQGLDPGSGGKFVIGANPKVLAELRG
jgi:hypothetical protein